MNWPVKQPNEQPNELTIAELIQRLKEFPPDAQVYAYEGEDIGIAIGELGELGWIPAHPWRG